MFSLVYFRENVKKFFMIGKVRGFLDFVDQYAATCDFRFCIFYFRHIIDELQCPVYQQTSKLLTGQGFSFRKVHLLCEESHNFLRVRLRSRLRLQQLTKRTSSRLPSSLSDYCTTIVQQFSIQALFFINTSNTAVSFFINTSNTSVSSYD